MPALKPITIVGGGLAGLTLGIGLRRQGIPVTVLEAGHYPRHRVCGEFISGAGQQTLKDLDLTPTLVQAGAVPAQSAAFCPRNGAIKPRSLPRPALCISRFVLDATLARVFCESGGVLEHKSARIDDFPEGFVRASGRRPHPIETGWRWFGLKAHARDVTLEADLEMHLAENGYVGICRLNEKEVNVCGLFRRAVGARDQASSWQQQLRGNPSTSLGRRLVDAEFDESSFCSVAGLSLRARKATENPECSIGDSLTMIPPVTGNGMSIAFESAGLAIVPLCDFSRGKVSWDSTVMLISKRCDLKFRKRLFWAKWLQRLMFTSLAQGGFGSLAAHSNLLWRLMFQKTR